MSQPIEINSKCKGLDDLFKEFEDSGVDVNRMDGSDLKKVKEICNQKNCIVWIHNFAKIEPYYINETGREYFGLDKNDLSEEGFDFFTNLVHPEDLSAIHRTIKYYSENPNGTNRLPYRARRQDGEMRWLYNYDRILNFNASKLPEYFVAMSFDIEDIITQSSNGANGLKATNEKRLLYKTLTSREKEVLHLVAQDMSSHEIGDQLFIETSTVDTHRKHIIKKLHVKSSMGLVQYHLLFSGNNF